MISPRPSFRWLPLYVNLTLNGKEQKADYKQAKADLEAGIAGVLKALTVTTMVVPRQP